MSCPDGFKRIRYYGLLGNRYRKDKLARCRELIGMSKMEPMADAADKDYRDTHEDSPRLARPVPSLPPRPYAAVPRPSAVHSGFH